MTYAHHCPFCGWHRPGASATMLDPTCERCGGTLRPVRACDLEAARREDEGGVERTPRGDGMSVLGLIVILPWLLPMLGVGLADVAFAVPLVLFGFAAGRALHRARERTPWRPVLLTLAAAAAACAVASAVGIVAAVVGGGESMLAFYAGACASAILVVAAVQIARRSLRRGRLAGLADAAVIGVVIVALVVWAFVLPGVRDGDLALTAVVAADLLALVLVGLSAVARGGRDQPGEWWLALGCLAATVGDGLVSAAAAGQTAARPAVTALAWGVAGFAFVVAADHGFRRSTATGQPRRDTTRARFLLWRVGVPLVGVLALPATAGALALAGSLDTQGIVYFTALSLVALGLAFGRQAHLLLDRQRAVVAERALRREATLRSEELEALTGLATTMTQTLEEAPIVEQALGVLHGAARASSAALHVATPAGPRVAAAAGRWHTERVWAPTGPVEDAEITHRGRREILRLPLAARGQAIGTVTLVRPASAPFDERGVGLLRLLVDQMAVAVQNARDYREKLEQAVRDPLTGLYNRRFLLEALEKEVQRVERYGTEAALAIFDVDDFKLVNDTLGHAAGDEVLRTIGAVAEAVIRPTDSFARIGGEEFALLLPETGRLEALLVAERLRSAVAAADVLPGRRVTVSAGLACCPGDAADAEELQRRADGALYWAKRNGKDLCAVASEVTGAAADDAGTAPARSSLAAVVHAHRAATAEEAAELAARAVALGEALGLAPDELERVRASVLVPGASG